MPYTTVTVDDLQSGQDERGFAGQADIDVQYWGDGSEWVIRSATGIFRSNGKWVWKAANPELFAAIRDEVMGDANWVRHINAAIGESLIERRCRMEDA